MALVTLDSANSTIVHGTQDDGTVVPIPASGQGHIEVEVHGPRLPFGSIHTERLIPVFQSDPVYGLNAQQEITTTSLTGGATATGGSFVASTGTTVAAFGVIQSRKRLRYRPGQGVVARFTARWPSSGASSTLVAGVGHSGDGVYFGYNGTAFGVLHSSRGEREVRTLTVTVGAGGSENVTVTLNGVPTVVAVTSGSATATAYQLSRGTYAGWAAEQVGATVVFVKNSAGAAADTYSVTSTGTAAGTFARSLAGAGASDVWVAQTAWNGDRLDGTGPSGITLDPSKFNVFQIGIQYLGAGCITFEMETVSGHANNPNWTTVHTLKFPNTRTTTAFGNPSFPFTLAAYSAGSSTNLSVESGSFSGFIEGEKVLNGPRFSYIGTVTSSTSAYIPLLTVRNTRYYGGRSNQSVVNILSASGAAKSNTGITTFYLLKDATLSTGTPNFAQYAADSATYVDTAATACTIASNNQIIWSRTVSETGDFDFTFTDDLTIQPGETYTLAARSVTATAVCVGGLNTREDQ